MRRTFLVTLVLGLLAFASVAHAIDRDFTVRNNLGNTIMQLYASPTTTTSWGGDLLGSGVLPDGGSVLVHYTPRMYRGQCVFDLRVVEDGGNEAVVRGINLCTITSVTFSREGGRVVFQAQ